MCDCHDDAEKKEGAEASALPQLHKELKAIIRALLPYARL